MRLFISLLLTLMLCGLSQAEPKKIEEKKTVEQVLEQYGPKVRKRLARFHRQLPNGFEAQLMKLVALKDSRQLEVWLNDPSLGWHQLRTYSIAKISGSLRPKAKRGDLLAPEGIYRLEAANPNSKYHLSLKLNYPNANDLRFARIENRKDLGDNIFIHGSNVSEGCLAMGNKNIEDLFVLAHDIGLENVEVVISPWDPSKQPLVKAKHLPYWVNEKYRAIETSLMRLTRRSVIL